MIDKTSAYVLIEIQQSSQILATFIVRRGEPHEREAVMRDARALILASLAACGFDPFNEHAVDGKLTISARGL